VIDRAMNGEIFRTYVRIERTRYAGGIAGLLL
jgi:hypothetical protein